jgi:hypothetical protein
MNVHPSINGITVETGLLQGTATTRTYTTALDFRELPVGGTHHEIIHLSALCYGKYTP